MQFERGQIYHHLRVLIETNGIKSTVLGRYLAQIKERLVSQIYRGVLPRIPDWLSTSKNARWGTQSRVKRGLHPDLFAAEAAARTSVGVD